MERLLSKQGYCVEIHEAKLRKTKRMLSKQVFLRWEYTEAKLRKTERMLSVQVLLRRNTKKQSFVKLLGGPFVHKTQLKNGLRVVMEKIPTFRSVSFGIWVKTGSRNESPDSGGISHFIEHMLFKGTKRYDAKEIAEQFDAIGGNVNAFTSKEYTCYYAKVLDEHLPIAVDVLSDMFFRSLFDKEELRKEKNVILEEIAMYEDTPDDMVHDLISEAA